MTTPSLAGTAVADVYCTLSCPRLIFVLGMVPRGVPNTDPEGRRAEAARLILSEALGAAVELVDGELFVELHDPIEAIVAARDHDLYLQRCIASGAALELLREPDAAARATWRWLCGKLAMSPSQTYPDGYVKLGIGRHTVPRAAPELAGEPGLVLWILPAAGDEQVVRLERATRISAQSHAAPGDLALADPSIDGGHCEVFARDGRWLVADRGSTSGTFCEGSRVAERRLLPGTMIRVGGSLLIVLAARV